MGGHRDKSEEVEAKALHIGNPGSVFNLHSSPSITECGSRGLKISLGASFCATDPEQHYIQVSLAEKCWKE